MRTRSDGLEYSAGVKRRKTPSESLKKFADRPDPMGELLKFCMITTFYPPYHFGGDAMYIYRLTNELARRGHKVDVIHCKDAYMLLRNEQSLGDFPNHSNVRTYPLDSWAGPLSPMLTQQTGVPFFKRGVIKSLLNSESYDVIHYHNMSLV